MVIKMNNDNGIDEKLIEQIVLQVLNETRTNGGVFQYADEAADDNVLDDMTAVNIRNELLVKNPHNREAYMRLKAKTPARLGIGKCGARYNTRTLLRIRADLAVAKDSVWTMVDQQVIAKYNMPIVRTKVEDKAQYLLRPDLGRVFNEENTQIIRSRLNKNPDVQIVIGDGLSSSAVEANIDDILPALEQGLKSNGIDPGTPVFVEFARVASGDFIAQEVGAKLVLVLIGERPGVASPTSLSCYMTYNPHVGVIESCRTVISNIHKNGTPPSEAGAHIAELVKLMLTKKKSGVELEL
jgi:ethanolamine ammonia-lyase small subunit